MYLFNITNEAGVRTAHKYIKILKVQKNDFENDNSYKKASSIYSAHLT